MKIKKIVLMDMGRCLSIVKSGGVSSFKEYTIVRNKRIQMQNIFVDESFIATVSNPPEYYHVYSRRRNVLNDVNCNVWNLGDLVFPLLCGVDVTFNQVFARFYSELNRSDPYETLIKEIDSFDWTTQYLNRRYYHEIIGDPLLKDFSSITGSELIKKIIQKKYPGYDVPKAQKLADILSLAFRMYNKNLPNADPTGMNPTFAGLLSRSSSSPRPSAMEFHNKLVEFVRGPTPAPAPAPVPEFWHCDICDTSNHISETHCVICGTENPSPPVPGPTPTPVVDKWTCPVCTYANNLITDDYCAICNEKRPTPAPGPTPDPSPTPNPGPTPSPVIVPPRPGELWTCLSCGQLNNGGDKCHRCNKPKPNPADAIVAPVADVSGTSNKRKRCKCRKVLPNF